MAFNIYPAVDENLKFPEAVTDAIFNRSLWKSTDDLNSWWSPGQWGVTGAKGMPPGVSSAAMIQIQAGNKAWQRIWISFGVDASVWTQWGNQNAGVWNAPTPLDTANNIDSAMAHELRVQDLKRRRGRKTTARGVVVFVLDHGYNNFIMKAWPDLQAKGFPVTWALNTVHPAAIDTGDSGINWADIKALATANPDKLEIAAHSANHGNVLERSNDLEAAIVKHKTDLQTLTGQHIDSWVQPGAAFGKFLKDNPGTPDDYANTRAGRMIYGTYACATGYITTPRSFALDGTPDVGVMGNWVDQGLGNIMTYVNSVANNGGYTIVRMHPQYMDQSGYITRAAWQDLLNQVKNLVDAGVIEVMTLRDASVATQETAISSVVGLQTALDLKASKSPKVYTGDLNTLFENGTFRTNYSTEVTSAKNYPIPNASCIVRVSDWYIVEKSVIQEVVYENPDNGTWTRRSTNGSWGAWTKNPTRVEFDSIFAPKVISGTSANLNNLTSPGRYRLSGSSDGSLANNFPINAGPNPVVDVEAWGVGGNVIQTVKYPRDHGVWTRGYWNGTWRNWENVGPIDAGSRLATLEYDTGWRSFTPVGPLLTGEGKILLRRVGSLVHCRFESVGVSSTVTVASYLTDALYIPPGFRPEYAGRPTGLMSNSNANPVYVISIAQGSRFRYQSTIASNELPSTGNKSIVGQMSWSTMEAPASLTALPGSPA